tara:strand:- start:4224 stop:4430 length:207 start_codon:yes stop_codon:yes gene_type:complete
MLTKSEVKQAGIIATAMTVLVTLIELPIVWAYLITKWVAAFVGAILGMLGFKLAMWAWKKAKAKWFTK